MCMYEKRSELSALRIAATLAIICLHTASALSDNGPSYALSVDQQFFFESIRNLMLWGVPIFYMITGTLLLDGKRTVTIKKNVLIDLTQQATISCNRPRYWTALMR